MLNKEDADKIDSQMEKAREQLKSNQDITSNIRMDLDSVKLAIQHLKKSNISVNNFLGVGIMLVFGAFISSSFLYVLFMYLLTIINANVLQSMEIFTSWLTTLILIFTGVWGAYFLRNGRTIHKVYNLKPWVYAILSAPIFACYLGYISIDFGSINALASAIGFNIATILKCVLIILLLTNKDE